MFEILEQLPYTMIVLCEINFEILLKIWMSVSRIDERNSISRNYCSLECNNSFQDIYS